MSTDDASPVPLLDLAPKLDRPLSLWNPVDYLRVLYWTFFFPQALGWYVEVFGVEVPLPADETPSRWSRFRAFVRTPTPQRNLYLQGLAVTILVSVFVPILLQVITLSIGWYVVVIGAILGVAFGVVTGAMLGVTAGVAAGVAGGVAGGVVASVAVSVLWGVAGSILLGLTGMVGVDLTAGLVLGMIALAMGVALGMAYGAAFSGAAGEKAGVAWSFAAGLAVIILWGFVLGVVLGVGAGMALSLSEGVAFGVAFRLSLGVVSGVAMGIGGLITLLRVPDFIVAGMVTPKQNARPGSRITPLPIPSLQKQLTGWLRSDPARGLSNVYQLQRYSLQFIPVVKAVNDWLATTPDEQLLWRAEQLANEPADWNLIRCGSAPLTNKLRDEFTRGMFVFPEQWRKHRPNWFSSKLRKDTPARAACGGYWALHAGLIKSAVEGFAEVRALPGGEVLHDSIKALDAALTRDDLTTIANWSEATSWMVMILATEVESIVVKVVRQLREVALEAAVARDSLSRLNRNAALSRAGAMLTHLLEDLDATYPELVRPVTRRIANQWRDVLSKAGGEIGQLAIDRPVFNPYVVGDPVVGRLFAGREPILRRLEELWGSDPTRPAQSVVLYGHRRMGKTSILRNLGARFGRDTVVVPFTMQRVGRVRDTGELLHALALWTHDALADAGLPAPDEPNEAEFTSHPYRAFNDFLAAARSVAGRRRVILTIDEFEAIEVAIRDGRVEAELLSYLRGVIQSEPWLVLAFAGLHTLQEMTGDYWNPLYGSVIPIKVGFFSPTTAANLLANPSDDFPLDFSREGAERVYEYVRGQPYLTQLVGHTLVNRYNDERFEQQQAREPRFTADEVDAVVASAEFYAVGDPYFSGIWSQADDAQAPGQHTLLLALARADGPATAGVLAEASGLSPDALSAALEALERHDVVAGDDAGRMEFTVPLMRRWLRQSK